MNPVESGVIGLFTMFFMVKNTYLGYFHISQKIENMIITTDFELKASSMEVIFGSPITKKVFKVFRCDPTSLNGIKLHKTDQHRCLVRKNFREKQMNMAVK